MTDTRSRDVVLREEDFAPQLRAYSATLGGWILRLVQEPSLLDSSTALSRFSEEAHRVETFLDDFGGRQNRTFVTFGELLASARGISGVKATNLHVLGRFRRYDLLVEPGETERDLRGADVTLHEALMALLQALVRESVDLALGWQPREMVLDDTPVRRLSLPRNIEFAEAVNERIHVAEIAGRFLKVLETSRSLDLGHVRAPDALPRYVKEFATEERCRWYESAVHNLQSMYDTYVLKTTLEQENPWLRPLRGHVSVALHLLEMATGLVHFYMRHENDIRHEPTATAIANVVQKKGVLHLAVNVCLRRAYLIIEGATGIADRILKTFAQEKSVELRLPDGMALHARPLALVVQVARYYGTPLEISLDGEVCAGSSLMALIMLGGKHPRPASIVARGDGRMLHDLELLFEAGLGENGRSLPSQLSYLRPSS